jgi:hypothetical protein
MVPSQARRKTPPQARRDLPPWVVVLLLVLLLALQAGLLMSTL